MYNFATVTLGNFQLFHTFMKELYKKHDIQGQVQCHVYHTRSQIQNQF